MILFRLQMGELKSMFNIWKYSLLNDVSSVCDICMKFYISVSYEFRCIRWTF